jgi:hypothetical protein
VEGGWLTWPWLILVYVFGCVFAILFLVLLGSTKLVSPDLFQSEPLATHQGHLGDSGDSSEVTALGQWLSLFFGPVALWLFLNTKPRRRRRKEENAAETQRKAEAKKQELKDLAEMKLAAQQEELAMAVREQERAKRNFEDVPARIPRDADDFETVCAEWMESAGFSEVARTPKGPDGGIDVIASNAVGQAKFHPSQKVTGESVRALVGSRVEREKSRALFFHYGPGYTPAAIEAARSTGVELYQLDVDRRRFKRIGNESDDFEEIDVPQEPSW